MTSVTCKNSGAALKHQCFAPGISIPLYVQQYRTLGYVTSVCVPKGIVEPHVTILSIGTLHKRLLPLPADQMLFLFFEAASYTQSL